MSIARYFNPKLRPKILAGNEPAWLLRHPRRGYIRAAVLSAGPWMPRWKLTLLRIHCQILTMRTGIEHVLDHEVPLNHPRVCGLTIGCNLRIITRAQNAAKSNHWCDDQMSLPL